MRYNAIISDRAKEMLGVHIRFLAQVNKIAATELKNLLISEIRSLEVMPNHYPFFNEMYMPVNKYHKMYVKNYYLVLYQIKDDTVFVGWIVDCIQDFQWLLR